MAITAAQGTALRAKNAEMDRHQALAVRALKQAARQLNAARGLFVEVDDPYATEEANNAIAAVTAAITATESIRT